MDSWIAHNVFGHAQTVIAPPPNVHTLWISGDRVVEGTVRYARDYLTKHRPDLLAAIDAGTVTDRASLYAWFQRHVPEHPVQHPPAP